MHRVDAYVTRGKSSSPTPTRTYARSYACVDPYLGVIPVVSVIVLSRYAVRSARMIAVSILTLTCEQGWSSNPTDPISVSLLDHRCTEVLSSITVVCTGKRCSNNNSAVSM